MHQLGDSLPEDILAAEHCDRRKFLNITGKGIAAAAILASPLTALAQDQKQKKGPDKAIHAASDKPIELKPLDSETEVKKGPVPNPINPDRRIGYAIVGLGTLALNQVLPAFGASKYAKAVALVSGHIDKARKVADQYGINPKNIYNYQNFDEIRNNPEVDVVYIILPNSMHAEFTIRAAQAGKHVLCEKPMASSSAEAQTMVDACKKAGRKLMIAYRIQYEPNNKQIKEWVRNKEYGEVKIIEAMNCQNIGDPSQWRLKKAMSGGAMGDVGIYCLNTIRYLLGEEPETVMASTYKTPGDERFKEVDETTMFQMKFPSGVMANCTTSGAAHEGRRYRCYANKGGWFGMDPAFPYMGLKMEVSQAKGKTDWKSTPSMGEKNQFALEMDHFSKCVMQDKQPYTPGEEGVQDMRIIEAIFESARTGREVKLAKVDKLDAFRGPEPTDD